MQEQKKNCGCEKGGNHHRGHGRHHHGGKPNFYGTATVGEKGQIVIPAEARKVNNIQPGDKLVVAGADNHPLMLIKADVLTDKIEHLSKKIEYLKYIQETEQQ